MDSILASVKKMLGIDEAYMHFDCDLIMHINSVFSVLQQLGVGPSSGFIIEGYSSEWSDFIEEKTTIEFVKSYVYLKVRLMFDPPNSGAVMDAMKNQINEFEWRLNVAVDPGTD